MEGFLAGTDTVNSLQRYWGLTPVAGVTQADISFNYLQTDVPGTANESNFNFIRRTGTTNAAFTPSSSNTTTNSFTLNGVNSFLIGL